MKLQIHITHRKDSLQLWPLFQALVEKKVFCRGKIAEQLQHFLCGQNQLLGWKDGY